MRLTLRTMLAYLDDVLEPADAKELGDKIRESKFASDLVHRIRNSMRRLRLGAPPIDGQGLGNDPNSVAEYLDSTMPTEQVPAFEKACLESDVQLAEVASCHQILTIVLGEPADVDPKLRERIYRLGAPKADEARGMQPAETNEAGSHNASAPATGATAVAATATHRESIDDVLAAMRDGTPQPAASPPANNDVAPASGKPTTGLSFKSMAITLALAFVLAIVALRAVDEFDRDHIVLRWLSGRGSESREVADRGSTALDEPAPNAGEIGANERPPTRSADSSSSAATDADEAVSGSGEPAEAQSETPMAPAGSPGVTDATAPANGAREPSQPGAAPPPSAGPLAGRSEPSESATTGDASAGTAAVPTAPAATAPAATVPVVPPAQDIVAEGIPVGRYTSEDQVLGRFDSSNDAWQLVPPNAPLASGDQLLTLPSYRPQLLLSPGIELTLTEETKASLLAPNVDGAPQIAIEYGAAVVLPVADSPLGIGLTLGAQAGVLVFRDQDSKAAVELRRFLPLGVDPEMAPAQEVIRLICVAGEIGWSQGGETPTVIPERMALAAVDAGPFELQNLAWWPYWIDVKPSVDIAARASRELQTMLDPSRPLARSLFERKDFHRQEVDDLVRRSLTCLDIYEPLVKALSDKRLRSFWGPQVDTLATINARGPESAARLRRVFEGEHPVDAATLYRMTWGYSPAQLDDGGAAELVGHLESQNMAVRVVAFQTLVQITGATYYYRPESPPEQEKQEITSWRRALEEGRINYDQPSAGAP